MAYLSAYSAVAINYIDLVEWLALQIERDFSTVTASLVHFLRRVNIGWIRNVWRSIDRLHRSAIVNNDLQWLGVEILQGADLKFSVNKPIMVLLRGIQTLMPRDSLSRCICAITIVPQSGQNCVVSEPYSTRD